jgi:hypothetical protein
MWGITVERAAGSRATARATRADSLLLKVRAQGARGARILAGSSDGGDAPLIASVLADAALCRDCLSRKTGIPRWRIDEVLLTIMSTLATTRTFGPCASCLKETVTYRLA